jgi:hypothetical protein
MPPADILQHPRVEPPCDDQDQYLFASLFFSFEGWFLWKTGRMGRPSFATVYFPSSIDSSGLKDSGTSFGQFKLEPLVHEMLPLQEVSLWLAEQ